MTITTNIDKRTRTTRQMTELQRDSFETLAKNFAALQRRNVELTQKWLTGAYRPFFPFTYAIYAQDGLKAAQQGTEEALEATQQATQQALEATQQVAQQGLRVAEEATVKAEQATAKAEQATAKAEQATMEAKQATAKTQAETREAALRLEEETREVALQAAVHRSLETKNYEELNVDEVSNKLDGLSATELKKVREYEEHNKNRETLITEIDRRISATA